MSEATKVCRGMRIRLGDMDDDEKLTEAVRSLVRDLLDDAKHMAGRDAKYDTLEIGTSLDGLTGQLIITGRIDTKWRPYTQEELIAIVKDIAKAGEA